MNLYFSDHRTDFARHLSSEKLIKLQNILMIYTGKIGTICFSYYDKILSFRIFVFANNSKKWWPAISGEITGINYCPFLFGMFYVWDKRMVAYLLFKVFIVSDFFILCYCPDELLWDW